MGLYLGGIFLATGNIVIPLLVHGLYDLAALSCLVRSRGLSASAPHASSGDER